MDFQNHGKGSTMLPLARVRTVFLLCILAARSSFPWIPILLSPSRGNVGEGISVFCHRIAMVLDHPSLEFLCRLFLLSLVSGGWRIIVNLSTLNLSVVEPCFFKWNLF